MKKQKIKGSNRGKEIPNDLRRNDLVSFVATEFIFNTPLVFGL